MIWRSTRSQRARRAQLERAGRGLHHLMGGNQRESGACLQHQPRHFAGLWARGHGNVFQAAAYVALRIGHRSAEKRRQTYPGFGARLHDVSVFS
jgi:hypothetical protein